MDETKEQELRREAVRLHWTGLSTDAIAEQMGRSDRWVRKWVARAEEAREDWAVSRSRRPTGSPKRTPESLRTLIVEARARLETNPRSQFGATAIAWELRRLGVEPLPGAWTINRVLAGAGLTRPRRRQPGYQSKGVLYPWRLSAAPGRSHQGDLVGPRHLDGGIRFSVFNVIDLGSHRLGTEVVERAWPGGLAVALARIWDRTGLPDTLQLDNHSNLRGGIPPLATSFGPVVATCLDLGVVPRFIPLQEPWRNGVVEHFNDTWDRAFFRTSRFVSLSNLREENAAFEAFHNAQHRYSAHQSRTPDEVMATVRRPGPTASYQPPARLPAKGRIEAVRFVRSAAVIDLWGHRVPVPSDHAYSYVLATIRVRSRELVVVSADGEVLHHGPFEVERGLR